MVALVTALKVPDVKSVVSALFLGCGAAHLLQDGDVKDRGLCHRL